MKHIFPKLPGSNSCGSVPDASLMIEFEETDAPRAVSPYLLYGDAPPCVGRAAHGVAQLPLLLLRHPHTGHFEIGPPILLFLLLPKEYHRRVVL
eukprot:gene11089-biopygen4828